MHRSDTYDDVQEVVDCYQRGLELSPNHATLHWKLGWAIMEKTRAYERAFPEFIRAGELGHEEAQYTLGFWYLDGSVVRQDYGKGRAWLEAAALQGSLNAKAGLGNMYYEGRGVDRDYSQAFKLLLEAAEAEIFVWEQFRVAVMYCEGKGVAQNSAQALRWCRKAISTGRPSKEFRAELLALQMAIERSNSISNGS